MDRDLIGRDDQYGLPLNPEERRFYRLIDERELIEETVQDANGNDRTITVQVITLACDHKSTHMVPLPDSQLYASCAECIRAFVAAEKAIHQ